MTDTAAPQSATALSEASGSVYDRSRSFAWADPLQSRAQAAGLSGLELMRGIRDGVIPEPPIARLIDFRCVVAEPGEIVMELELREDLENPMGLIHGGVAATLLDTAMGAAVHTRLPIEQASVTLDLKLTYMRPLMVRSGRMRATGRVLNLGRTVAYAEGEVRDAKGALCVHAVGNFALVTAGGR